MADDLELNTKPLLVVDEGNSVAIAGQKFRELMLVLGALGTVLHFAKSRDMAGLIAWANSDGAVPIIGAALAILASVWNTVRLVINKQRLVTVSKYVHDSVSTIVSTRTRLRLALADVKAWIAKQRARFS